MLSEVIHSRHSYAAVPLAGQQPHQRSVHSGPLVLGANPLKIQRLQKIGDQPVSRITVLHLALVSKPREPLFQEGSDYSIALFLARVLTFSLYGHSILYCFPRNYHMIAHLGFPEISQLVYIHHCT